MSTAAGIAYGMAAAGLHSTTVHAVRVSPSVIANRAVMARILRKTANILGTIDPALPEQAAANWVLRSEYFAPGYARDNPATRRALEVANDQLDLQLEATYTGKALACLLDDIGAGRTGRVLFWNTYSSVRPPVASLDETRRQLPADFTSYL